VLPLLLFFKLQYSTGELASVYPLKRYEPMKSVCEKYPEWLAMQGEALSTQDYERYGAQYQVGLFCV